MHNNTHTNQKNLSANNSSLVVAQKQLTRLLVIQNIESLIIMQESKPKT
jgi:hypothetical protein